MSEIEYYNKKNEKYYKFLEEPDSCPICKQGIKPTFCYIYEKEYGVIEIVYECPLRNCKHLFVAYFYYDRGTRGLFSLSKTGLPFVVIKKEFSGIIGSISKMFVSIYNQSFLAENNGLDQIAGCGYRKALEFLVKDYLISVSPKKNLEKIKKMWLGKAIEIIDSKNIRICAERAAWLGNDETHYIRKWEDKDITNLKDLIDLIVMWIDSEEKTKKYEKEMSGK